MFKRVFQFWQRRSFASQLALSFFCIAIMPVLVLFYVNFNYNQDAMEKKIIDSGKANLRQAAKNISNTLKGYEDAALQLTIDNTFIREISDVDMGSIEQTIRAKNYLSDSLRTFINYRIGIRSLIIRTSKGNHLIYDKLIEDSKPNLIHIYDELLNSGEGSNKLIDSKWNSTRYIDTQGMSDYYLFSYKQKIIDITSMEIFGEFLMNVNEDILSDICDNSMVSQNVNDNYMFIIDNTGGIVSHYDKTMIGKSILQVFGLANTRKILNDSSTDTPISISTDNGTLLVSSANIPLVGWKVINIINKEYLTKEMFFSRNITTAIFFFLLLFTLIAVSIISKKMSKSIEKILLAMNKAESGTFSVQIDLDNKNEIALIGDRFNQMMQTIKQLMEDLQKQMEMVKYATEQEKKAEIMALEAQINPHFLYNTLDSINWIAIENEQNEISNMLNYLAIILRYSIDKSNCLVSIGEELEYLEKYLYLQKYRFSDSFNYIFDVEEGVKKFSIYKLIFQPFIENSIIHGYSQIRYGGILRISIKSYSDDKIKFTISDNGKGMAEKEVDELFNSALQEKGSIGIPNVLTRLRMYYGEDHSVKVTSKPEQGTTIEIIIPKSLNDKQ